MSVLYDPLRRKDVTATPEEQVRQWFISVLSSNCKVPLHMMMSEVGFKFGAKQYRADIVVYSRDASPLLIVECKRPEVTLDAAVVEQAMRYNMVLGVSWLVLTNGVSTLAFRREGTSFVPAGSLPTYDEISCSR